MDVKKKKALMAASIAGLIAVAAPLVVSGTAFAEGVPCYGINKCKGAGDCGGKGHGCAGKNACKGAGFVNVADNDTCLKIQGGSLTPVEA